MKFLIRELLIFPYIHFNSIHSTGNLGVRAAASCEFLICKFKKNYVCWEKKWGRGWTSPSLMQCALWLDLTLQKTKELLFCNFSNSFTQKKTSYLLYLHYKWFVPEILTSKKKVSLWFRRLWLNHLNDIIYAFTYIIRIMKVFIVIYVYQ